MSNRKLDRCDRCNTAIEVGHRVALTDMATMVELPQDDYSATFELSGENYMDVYCPACYETNRTSRDVLFILTVDDMADTYDLKKGEGSFNKLSEEEKTDLALDVKKNLSYGLGEAWAEYMDVSVELALENWSK